MKCGARMGCGPRMECGARMECGVTSYGKAVLEVIHSALMTKLLLQITRYACVVSAGWMLWSHIRDQTPPKLSDPDCLALVCVCIASLYTPYDKAVYIPDPRSLTNPRSLTPFLCTCALVADCGILAVTWRDGTRTVLYMLSLCALGVHTLFVASIISRAGCREPFLEHMYGHMLCESDAPPDVLQLAVNFIATCIENDVHFVNIFRSHILLIAYTCYHGRGICTVISSLKHASPYVRRTGIFLTAFWFNTGIENVCAVANHIGIVRGLLDCVRERGQVGLDALRALQVVACHANIDGWMRVLPVREVIMEIMTDFRTFRDHFDEICDTLAALASSRDFVVSCVTENIRELGMIAINLNSSQARKVLNAAYVLSLYAPHMLVSSGKSVEHAIVQRVIACVNKASTEQYFRYRDCDKLRLLAKEGFVFTLCSHARHGSYLLKAITFKDAVLYRCDTEFYA